MTRGGYGRTLSLSRSGRFLALRCPGRIEVIDALGTSPRHSVAIPHDIIDFSCVGAMLWVLDPGGTIERYALNGLRPILPGITIGAGGRQITSSAGEHAVAALVSGARELLVYAQDDHVVVDELALDAVLFPMAGRRVLAVAGDLRIVEPGRGDVARMPRPDGGTVLDATSLFDGRAIALLVGTPDAHVVVLRATGGLVHKIAVPQPTHWAFAESRGLAVFVIEDRELIAVDLRYGRIQERHVAALAIDELAFDADGQFIAFASKSEQPGAPPRIHHLAYTDFVAAARRGAKPAEPAHDDDESADPPAAVYARAVIAEPLEAVPVRADAAELLAADTPLPPPPVVVPDRLPRALGDPLVPLVPLEATAPSGMPPYESAHEHIDELLDVIAARTGRAIAQAWNSGRLSTPTDDLRPFEREVLAILGRTGGYALDLLANAEARLTELTRRSAARASATIASGRSLPLLDLLREMSLSSTAVYVLLAIVAPQIRGELARLYGVLANDEHRSLVDRFLVEALIAGDDLRLRAEVAAELAPNASLIRYGLVRHDGATPLFAALSIDPVLVDRICGRDDATPTDVSTLRHTNRTLDELCIPATLKRELVLALAEPRSRDAPIRIVLRGRRGAGRHSLVAALAARIDHRVAEIDVHRLPRAPKLLASGLRTELTRALLRRAVPVVSGLETIDAADAEGQDLIKQTVRAHPGPIVIRAAPEGALPIETGYVSFTLPSLTESERAAFWAAALVRANLPVADVDALAQPFRIGPGVIERVIGEVVTRRTHLGTDPGDDVGQMILEAARQHIAIRLGNVAARVTRLARWEQVSLADDVLDSLKEFIARTRHRRTVYDRWGFDAKMTTSRGLSALFYGPPGTGKSMVAGLIARELGLELYRVDLARVVSKWIGETEKNLAEIFDAAEDGQVIILFDEADSLFAKRTEVKSSVDRYANLEVNYLLQRLDSFEGICILTTNLEGSVDQAFKRRMSLRLQFPFPDEEMRARLWAAHVPADTPTLGDFDYADLARRFPLSGGYIRNSVLRAAFLAAQETRPLSQDHLLRAIQLEYRELGKLSTTGRME